MTPHNDNHYIKKTLGGAVNSFGILVEKYQDMVYGLAYKMLKNREEAEEVSQDTFIKAYKSLSRFNGDSKFSTWLYRIAYNTSLDLIKRNAKFQNSVEIDDVVSGELVEFDTIYESIEKKERAKIVEACMAKMSKEERGILHLFYFEELSIKEIVEVTSEKENNVKVKLHRARKKLFTIFKTTVSSEIYSHYER